MRTLGLLLLVACSGSSQHAEPPSRTAPSGKAVDPAAALETKSEDITLTVGTRAVPGTIVEPTEAGPWPAVILLAGSGPTDRDWNSKLIPTKNGSGKLLAEALAAHGAVVIRFDKAASGANPGPPLAELTLDTYRDEAMAALAALKGRAHVRKDRIFVAGHSEGGIHATRLAAAAGSDIAGVIYLSSASRSMADTILTQVEGSMRNPRARMDSFQVDKEMQLLRAAFADFFAGKEVDPTKASTLVPLQGLFASVARPETAGLTRSLLAFDNRKEAPKNPQPSLLVNGGKDVQIDIELDAKPLHAALTDAKRDSTLKLAPDADHVLKHEPRTIVEIRADLKATQDGYNADGRVIDPDVVNAVVGWLAERTK